MDTLESASIDREALVESLYDQQTDLHAELDRVRSQHAKERTELVEKYHAAEAERRRIRNLYHDGSRARTELEKKLLHETQVRTTLANCYHGLVTRLCATITGETGSAELKLFDMDLLPTCEDIVRAHDEAVEPLLDAINQLNATSQLNALSQPNAINLLDLNADRALLRERLQVYVKDLKEWDAARDPIIRSMQELRDQNSSLRLVLLKWHEETNMLCEQVRSLCRSLPHHVS